MLYEDIFEPQFVLIYNNVYALFSYCLCFVIYVLQQVYKSVS